MKPKKMSRQDLDALWPAYEPGGATWKGRATNKGHVHAVNPVWMPPKSKMTPAQWRRAHKGRKAGAKKAGAQ